MDEKTRDIFFWALTISFCLTFFAEILGTSWVKVHLDTSEPIAVIVVAIPLLLVSFLAWCAADKPYNPSIAIDWMRRRKVSDSEPKPDSVKKTTSEKNADSISKPPRIAELLICLFINKKFADSVTGDLEEEFQNIQKRYGIRAAKAYYYKQVATSLWPLLQAAIQKLIRWGLIGWIEEVFRHRMH